MEHSNVDDKITDNEQNNYNMNTSLRTEKLLSDSIILYLLLAIVKHTLYSVILYIKLSNISKQWLSKIPVMIEKPNDYE